VGSSTHDRNIYSRLGDIGVLQDTLTKGERSLMGNSETALVLANRKAYQNAMGPDLIASVEEISGRKVIAFLSDNHIEPDYAVESFVLEPRVASDVSEAEQMESA
jgi:uncharacterized protein YbcI